MSPPILCLVVDRSARAKLSTAVFEAVRAGVDWLQLRERELEGAALLAWCRELRDVALEAAAASGRDIEIIVNRRIDVALSLGGAGAHLGYDALSLDDARVLMGEAALIGVSAHDPGEVGDAAAQGASYAHLAPVFDPLSKPATRTALGCAALEASSAHGIPVLAQGGIEPGVCAEVIAAGAAGVAVTGAILLNPQPGRAAEALRSALDATGH